MNSLQSILDYWFEIPNDYQKWFFSGSSLDTFIKKEFESLLKNSLNNNKSLFKPKNEKEILAIIILYDQFSRHIYRNTKNAYATDHIALEYSLELLNTNKINDLSPIEQLFALMPLQHSENIKHKNILLDFANKQMTESSCNNNLYNNNLYKNLIEHTKNHRTVLELFGRYPKRNMSLGLESSTEELLYMKEFPDRHY
jgi:uncharacterized protein (DUF924 family)